MLSQRLHNRLESTVWNVRDKGVSCVVFEEVHAAIPSPDHDATFEPREGKVERQDRGACESMPVHA